MNALVLLSAMIVVILVALLAIDRYMERRAEREWAAREARLQLEREVTPAPAPFVWHGDDPIIPPQLQRRAPRKDGAA